jgi:hypothetical protein
MYWWISYAWGDRNYFASEVDTKHPFTFIAESQNLDGFGDIELLNFKKITKEEYDLYKKLNP